MPPLNAKKLKSLMGKPSYIQCFIPGLAAIIRAFAQLLRKWKKFVWTKEYEETYQRVQQLVTNLPTIKASVPSIPLKLYLAATSTIVRALLAQDSSVGEEALIYYVSRQLRSAETRYEKTELICLALRLCITAIAPLFPSPQDTLNGKI